MSNRNTRNYDLKDGKKIVYRGTTKRPLEQRLAEHDADGKRFTHAVQVGPARSPNSAKEKEAQLLQTYRDSHGGKNPKYNKDSDG